MAADMNRETAMALTTTLVVTHALCRRGYWMAMYRSPLIINSWNRYTKLTVRSV